MKRVTVSSDDDPFMKAFSGASPPASGTPSNAQSTAQPANSGKSTFGSSFFKNAFNKKATPTNQSTNAPSPTVSAPTTPSNGLSNGQSSESEDINPDLDRERRRKAAATSATPTNQSTSQTVSQAPDIVRSQSLNQPANHVLFGLQPAVIPELGPPVNPLLPYQDFTQVDDNVMLDYLDDWDSHGEIAGEKPVMEIPNVFYYRDAESINQNTQQAYAHSITRNASGQSASNQTSGASGGSYQPPSTVFHEDKSTVLGKLYMTNYQLYLEPLIDRKERAAKIVLEGVIAVPLATIERVEHEKPKGHLKILDCHCKDGRVLRFGFLEPEQARKAYDCLITYVFPSKDDYLFCFYHKPRMPIPVHLNGWNLYSPIVEFKRMGIPNHGIRLTKANMKYQLSTSYPALLAVPNEKYFSDAELEAVAVFRSRGRVPACTWQHPHGRQTIWRSSQPRVGMNNARSTEDEKMLYAISAATGVKDIAIFDCRPKMNAQANRLAGKGFESAENYRNCRIYFMDIENIHAMRASYQALIKACSSDSHSVGFQQALNASKWLTHVAGVLKATFQMVMAVDRDKLSVLSHCSDGWDRTSQLVTLTELCLDPYYRTLEGFCVLVEKDWLSFGHQFAKRTGHRENKSTDEQRSPIMLQWLDCVFQLTQQFPRHFEFNSHFLVTLQSHLYSCRFGTFLFNTEYMRKKTKLHTNTVSLWTYFMCSPAACRGEFSNPLYAPNGTGAGVASADLGLWKKESHVLDCINKRVNAGETVLVNANAAGMTSVTAGPADSVSIPVPVPDVAASDASDASSTEGAVSSENAESSDTHEVSKATDDSVAETSAEEATSNGDAHPLHAKPSTSPAPSVPPTQATAAPTTSNTPVPTARRASPRVDEDLPEPRKSSVGRGGGDGTAKDYTGAVLYPSWSLKKVTLWSDYYLRWHSDQAEHGSSMGPIGPGSVPPGGAATTHFLSVDSILSRSIRQHAELANELEDEVAALKQKLIDAGLSPDVTITPAITHDPSARRNKLRPARPVYDVTRYENVLNEDEDLSNIQEQDEPDDVEDAQM